MNHPAEQDRYERSAKRKDAKQARKAPLLAYAGLLPKTDPDDLRTAVEQQKERFDAAVARLSEAGKQARLSMQEKHGGEVFAKLDGHFAKVFSQLGAEYAADFWCGLDSGRNSLDQQLWTIAENDAVRLFASRKRMRPVRAIIGHRLLIVSGRKKALNVNDLPRSACNVCGGRKAFFCGSFWPCVCMYCKAGTMAYPVLPPPETKPEQEQAQQLDLL